MSEAADDWPQAFATVARAREAIASIVTRVGDGELDLDGAFAVADADPTIGRVFALKVFEAVPGIGKVRARRTMAQVGIDGEASIASVSADDRRKIVELFAQS